MNAKDVFPFWRSLSKKDFVFLNRHQRFDRLLDIITGFHIIDESMHLLVVEGLQNQGIKTLIDRFGDTDLPGKKAFLTCRLYPQNYHFI